MTHTDHRDRVVMITGGAHGIGEAIARAFANAGDRVIIADRQGDAAEQTAASIASATGGEVMAATVDVRDAAAVKAAVAQALARFERIDVLVNNAGIYPNTPVVEMDEAEWDAVFDINVKGMFLVSQAVARAIELAPYEIVVNAVGPGLIEVPGASLTREYVDALIAATPMRRIGQPEDVAQAVLYLASPSATYMTGTTLYVDGGGLAGRALSPSG